MTVDRLTVESMVRVDDKDQFDAIKFSHGLGQ
jgi:hypothetical protein